MPSTSASLSGTKRGVPKDLVKIFKLHADLVPNAGNCLAVFFLYSEFNFVACWNDWLLPGLRRRGYQVSTTYLCVTAYIFQPCNQEELLWDASRLYGPLMHYLINHPREVDGLPEELQHIVRNTLEHRRMLKDFRRAVFHQHERCT